MEGKGGNVPLVQPLVQPSPPTEGHNSPHGQHSLLHVYKEK